MPTEDSSREVVGRVQARVSGVYRVLVPEGDVQANASSSVLCARYGKNLCNPPWRCVDALGR